MKLIPTPFGSPRVPEARRSRTILPAPGNGVPKFPDAGVPGAAPLLEIPHGEGIMGIFGGETESRIVARPADDLELESSWMDPGGGTLKLEDEDFIYYSTEKLKNSTLVFFKR
jgi:hypothetical protein